MAGSGGHNCRRHHCVGDLPGCEKRDHAEGAARRTHRLMPQRKSQIAVLGVTGYAGAELARLLLRHPQLAGAPPLFLGRESSSRESLTAIHPQLAGLTPEQLCVEPFSWDLLASRGVKTLFLATPHEQSRKLAPEALAHGVRIIDLSGAWGLEGQANRSAHNFSHGGWTPL